MKCMMFMLGAAWGAVIVEQGQPTIVPQGAVLWPVVIAGMLWTRTATGVFTGGVVLIVDWIARPQGLPLLPVALTLGVTLLLQRPSHDRWSGKRAPRMVIPMWAQPIALTIVAVALVTVPATAGQRTSMVESLQSVQTYAVISLPLTLLLTGLMKLAGEFGCLRLSQR